MTFSQTNQKSDYAINYRFTRIILVVLFILTTISCEKKAEDKTPIGQEEAQYQKALELTQAEKYSEAIELWSTIGNYKDSYDQLMNAIRLNKEKLYSKILDLMEKGQLSQAKALLDELGLFKDTQDIRKKLDQLKAEGKY